MTSSVTTAVPLTASNAGRPAGPTARPAARTTAAARERGTYREDENHRKRESSDNHVDHLHPQRYQRGRAPTTTAPTSGGWPGDFKESPLEATDLSPGDFVTVTATKTGDEVVAESVAVMRLAGDPTLRASRLPVKR